MIYNPRKGTITITKINVCHKYLLSRVSNKLLTQSREYCIYSVRTSRTWDIAKRNRILFKNKNREPIARLYYQTHYEKWIQIIICYSLCFHSMLSTEVFFFELHCFSYFYQRPLNKYFVLCFYIQTKQKQCSFINSRNYSRQYYFR